MYLGLFWDENAYLPSKCSVWYSDQEKEDGHHHRHSPKKLPSFPAPPYQPPRGYQPQTHGETESDVPTDLSINETEHDDYEYNYDEEEDDDDDVDDSDLIATDNEKLSQWVRKSLAFNSFHFFQYSLCVIGGAG